MHVLRQLANAENRSLMAWRVLVDDLSLKGSGAAVVVLKTCMAELARDAAKAERDRKRLEHIPVDLFAEAARKTGDVEK